jgi:hypothetical protein
MSGMDARLMRGAHTFRQVRLIAQPGAGHDLVLELQRLLREHLPVYVKYFA